MAKIPPKIERYQNSRHQHRQVKFAQIVTDATRDLSHRGKDAFDAERIDPISASIVQEDLATPFTVFETTEFIELDGERLEAFGLAGGFRRREAIEKNIIDNIDPKRFYRGMEVPVIVMVRGEHQSQESFDQDVLVRSVLENEQRASLSQPERLGVVSQFVHAKVPKPRAASALAMSLTNYDRYSRVVRLVWLHRGVLDGHIGLTDASTLAEAAENDKRLDQFQSEFATWVRQKQALLERERAEQKKLDRELKGPAAQLKKYLDAATVKVWLACLKNGKPFIEATADFNFGVVIDESKKTVEIPRMSLPIDKLRSAHVTQLITEMQTGMRSLVKLRKSLQIREQAVDMTDEQVEEELRRLDQLAREQAAKKAEQEAGREPEAMDAADDPAPADMGAALDEAIDAVRDHGAGDRDGAGDAGDGGDGDGDRDNEGERRD